jgi:hypothetical protein
VNFFKERCNSFQQFDEQSLTLFLKELPLAKLEILYAQVFDVLVAAHSAQLSSVFSVIDEDMLTITERSGQTVYNRLLRQHWPMEKELTRVKTEKDRLASDCRFFLKDDWMKTHIRSANKKDTIKIKFENFKKRYVALKQKYLKTKDDIYAYRTCMIEFLLHVRKVLNSMQTDRFVCLFDQTCQQAAELENNFLIDGYNFTLNKQALCNPHCCRSDTSKPISSLELGRRICS